MANTITRTTLVDGAGKYVVLFTIIGDGSGEETATRVNTTSGDLGTNASILKVQGAVSGFQARLLFDATTDVYALQLPTDVDIEFNFREFGGVKNFAGSGKTGDILITTNGLGAGDSGSFIITCLK